MKQLSLEKDDLIVLNLHYWCLEKGLPCSAAQKATAFKGFT